MSKIEATIWIGGSGYLVVSTAITLLWIFEIYKTVVAKRAAVYLRSALIDETCPKHRARNDVDIAEKSEFTQGVSEEITSSGREGLGHLLNDLDHLLRDNEPMSPHELDHLVLALSVAHLLRAEESFDRSSLDRTVGRLGSQRLGDIKLRERVIISPKALGEFLRPYGLSWFQLRCLADRLTQNWNELSWSQLKQAI